MLHAHKKGRHGIKPHEIILHNVLTCGDPPSRRCCELPTEALPTKLSQPYQEMHFITQYPGQRSWILVIPSIICILVIKDLDIALDLDISRIPLFSWVLTILGFGCNMVREFWVFCQIRKGRFFCHHEACRKNLFFGT
jgi:hypothetical protein